MVGPPFRSHEVFSSRFSSFSMACSLLDSASLVRIGPYRCVPESTESKFLCRKVSRVDSTDSQSDISFSPRLLRDSVIQSTPPFGAHQRRAIRGSPFS
jgi:hypothetical protein